MPRKPKPQPTTLYLVIQPRRFERGVLPVVLRAVKPCPECGGPMEKIVAGVISEPVFNLRRTSDEVVRRSRLCTYYACTECEHCEEK